MIGERELVSNIEEAQDDLRDCVESIENVIKVLKSTMRYASLEQRDQLKLIARVLKDIGEYKNEISTCIDVLEYQITLLMDDHKAFEIDEYPEYDN